MDNTELASRIGLVEAIVINMIKQATTTEDGYVSYNPDIWTNLTGLPQKQIQEALDNLVKLDYVETRIIFTGYNWIKSQQYKIK